MKKDMKAEEETDESLILPCGTWKLSSHPKLQHLSVINKYL